MKTKKGKNLIVFSDKKRHETDGIVTNWNLIEIPCGQCMDCRRKRRKEWSIRLMYELPKHNNSYFITLTYDDEHLPENNSLVTKDMQQFIKRWRGSKTSDYRRLGLKMYYCGEYGDLYKRPHYHMIRFLDNEIPDLTYYKASDGGPLYTSELLSKRWGMGYVVIGSVTQESCEYVRGYINKKILGKGRKVYEERGVIPPFTISSNGISILDEKQLKEIYRYDTIHIAGRAGNIKNFKPPKDFDKQLEQYDKDWYDMIKDHRREIRIIERERVLMNTTQPEDEYLLTAAQNRDRKTVSERKDL